MIEVVIKMVEIEVVYIDTRDNTTYVSHELERDLQLLFFYIVMIFSSVVLGCLCSYIAFLRYVCIIRQKFKESRILTHSVKSVTV